eukprot:m.1516730 g.1516730  ORF g.1516730 m.1516730 type:complete len:65 (+) comp25218_c1_seq7:2164-2358(+)
MSLTHVFHTQHLVEGSRFVLNRQVRGASWYYSAASCEHNTSLNSACLTKSVQRMSECRVSPPLA